jgi:hypothetical protein
VQATRAFHEVLDRHTLEDLVRDRDAIVLILHRRAA